MPKSSIASLFGPTAEEIVYAKQQQDKLLEQQELQAALGRQQSAAAQTYYQSGYNIAKGLGGLFGGESMMVDPAIKKAVNIRKIVAEFDGKNLNDPTVLESIAERMADQGYVNESALLFDRAFDLEYKTASLEAAREQKTPSTGHVGLDEKGNEVVLLKDNYGNFYDATTRKLWTGPVSRVMSAQEAQLNLLKQGMSGVGGKGTKAGGTDLDGTTVEGKRDDPAARAALTDKINKKKRKPQGIDTDIGGA